METFTLIVWLHGNTASPPDATFPGLTEYQCEYWIEELSEELPRWAASVCRPDSQSSTAINPVHRYWKPLRR
jgi:hypothetical protein